MFLKVARAIARPQTFAILDLLKRSTGLSVNEIAKALKLSYMGVKQYCTELEKKGLVDTWRRPTTMGRPEKSYRLTPKAASFYPEVGNEMTLDLLKSIAQLYGETAPDKLLFNYFNKKADAYLKKLKGATITEKATSFAKLRDAEGCCAQIEYDEENGYRVVEYHSPMKEIADEFPNVQRMEELMFSKVLGLQVTRTEDRVSGLMKISFRIPLQVIPQGLVATPTVKAAKPAGAPAKAPRLKKAVAPAPVEVETVAPSVTAEHAKEGVVETSPVVAAEEPMVENATPMPAPAPAVREVQEELFLLVG